MQVFQSFQQEPQESPPYTYTYTHPAACSFLCHTHRPTAWTHHRMSQQLAEIRTCDSDSKAFASSMIKMYFVITSDITNSESPVSVGFPSTVAAFDYLITLCLCVPGSGTWLFNVTQMPFSVYNVLQHEGARPTLWCWRNWSRFSQPCLHARETV